MDYDKEKVDEYTSGEKIDESDRKTMRFCVKAFTVQARKAGGRQVTPTR